MVGVPEFPSAYRVPKHTVIRQGADFHQVSVGLSDGAFAVRLTAPVATVSASIAACRAVRSLAAATSSTTVRMCATRYSGTVRASGCSGTVSKALPGEGESQEEDDEEHIREDKDVEHNREVASCAAIIACPANASPMYFRTVVDLQRPIHITMFSAIPRLV